MCRIKNYYPLSSGRDGDINYVATLDDMRPVRVLYNHYPSNYYVGSTVINLFDLVDCYNNNVPIEEDWFVCKQSDLDFDTDIRERNIRKYTKSLVYNMLLRLCTHGVFTSFYRKDIIKYSWDGEKNSFFRPYYTIHVDKKHRRPAGWIY